MATSSDYEDINQILVCLCIDQVTNNIIATFGHKTSSRIIENVIVFHA